MIKLTANVLEYIYYFLVNLHDILRQLLGVFWKHVFNVYQGLGTFDSGAGGVSSLVSVGAFNHQGCWE